MCVGPREPPPVRTRSPPPASREFEAAPTFSIEPILSRKQCSKRAYRSHERERHTHNKRHMSQSGRADAATLNASGVPSNKRGRAKSRDTFFSGVPGSSSRDVPTLARRPASSRGRKEESRLIPGGGKKRKPKNRRSGENGHGICRPGDGSVAGGGRGGRPASVCRAEAAAAT